MSTPALPRDLKAKVLAAAAAKPAPTRAEWKRRALLVSLACAAVAVGWWQLKGGARLYPVERVPGDVFDRPLSLALGTMTGSAVIAALTMWAAWGRRGSIVGRSAAALTAIAIASPVALLAFKLLWTAPYGAHQFLPWIGGGDVPPRVGYLCLRLSLFIAAWPMIALVTLRRGGVATQPVLTGVVFGVASGACAWVLVDTWCPVCYPEHLLLGHVLPIAIYAGVGAAVGRWVLAVRAD